jgi:hypothetical protein
MLDLELPAVINAQDQANLNLIPVVDRPKRWDKSRAQLVTRFKTTIMTHGMAVQDSRCAWCTLPVGAAGHRTAHRDHIAPKERYPQWTFTPMNLIVACEYCNGFAVKHDLDTIEVVQAEYEQCTFWIVHPYLDIVSDHVGFMEEEVAAQSVAIQGRSPRGHWTIEKLQLASPEMTSLRARELAADRAISKLAPHYQNLLARATGR